jgi:hypothetical protein
MQFSLFSEADRRKQDGMALVITNAGDAWRQAAEKACLEHIRRSGEIGCLFEDAIFHATQIRGLPMPHHQNAWGPICSSLARKGLIARTGVYNKSKHDASHARVNPVWRAK